MLNAPYNPRTISGKAKLDLRKSIENHGLLGSPIWNKRTGNIVGGHQRVEQLDMLEGTQNYSLLVSEIDVDERAEKAINIALNNLNLQGEMDAEAIVNMVRNNEFDLEMSGYKPIDIEMFAFNAGLSTDLIEGLFTPQALEQVDQIANEIDDVVDQADELKRRKSGVKRQPQDEDGREDQEQEDGGAGEVPHDAEYFRNIRNKPTESMRVQRDVGYFVTLVFGSTAQCNTFCDFVGIPRGQAQADGPTIAELCGCKLPELEGKRKAPKDDPGVETANQGDV